MKNVVILIVVLSINFLSCQQEKKELFNKEQETKIINKNIDKWHEYASKANFEGYFGLMTKKSVFIGTDATENWNTKQFQAFSKPYFNKGKAWNFTPLERHVYFSQDGKTAWFDELLDTQMGICRGSGVLQIEDNTWKISHYVLSIAIPNDNVSEVVTQKKEFDSILTAKIRNKN